jgi:ABC-2 type transport system permease protein
MFRNVFVKSLRDQRRGLIGWSIGLALLVILETALWPSVRAMPELEKLLANYPEAMRKLFNVEAMTTGAGFLNVELYSMLLPALFLVFAIGRGARLIAGEERTGTLEVLLTTPVPRLRVLLEKAAALAVSVAALGVVLFATTAVSGLLAGMEIPLAHLAAAAAAMVLLGIEHGWLALAVGAATGRRGLAIGIPGSIAVAGYVLYVMATLVEAVEPFGAASPFHQALEGGPIGAGFPAAYGWMALGAVLVLIASLPVFARRDVAAMAI